MSILFDTVVLTLSTTLTPHQIRPPCVLMTTSPPCLSAADKDTGNGRYKYDRVASWVVQGKSYLSAQVALTPWVCSQLPGIDDRLIQTYSHAANPNGSILTSVPVCCVIKQPLSVTSVKVFSSKEVRGGCRSLKISVKSNRYTTVSVTLYSGHGPPCLLKQGCYWA